MNKADRQLVKATEKAALEVLLNNMEGPFLALPRTAGWGYPEPYTRDLLVSVLGIAVTDHPDLLQSVRNVLLMLARNQSRKGHIPSLVHDKENRGASDTTPLFLIATAIYRSKVHEPLFLEDSVKKAFLWMEYQSPEDRCLVAQLPTSDWRDEQWVLGYGLFVNSLVYTYLHMFNMSKKAESLKKEIEHFCFDPTASDPSKEGGLALRAKPYFALWAYKIYSSQRFDLLGNSIAILSGLAETSKAQAIIRWVETSCETMRSNKELAVSLPPNLFPYIREADSDWLPRYKEFNKPGEYHNGGIWPFISGLYIAALVAAKEYELAENQLMALTHLVKVPAGKELEFGFNEWYRAQDGLPGGQDWQTWSASNYLYAARCVAERRTPFFDAIR